jgi:crotonobetainyl-CoA:carnitine CoA-transferase CaiB-like acyl-CoA transferase
MSSSRISVPARSKLGLDFAALAAASKLIYVSISGFGQTGPRRDEAGHDAVVQAEGGLMSITGTPDGPLRDWAPFPMAAGMFAFQGLLLALSRAANRHGQLVDVSLLDSTAALLTYQAMRVLVAGDAPTRLGNRHASIAPYDTFETAEGVLVLAVGNDDQWQRFCRAAGQLTLGDDPRFTTNALRVRHYDILQPLLHAVREQ